MRILACVLALVATSAAAATVPEYDAIRAARLDGRHVAVKGLVLQRDAFTIELRSGVVYFLAPVGTETFGAVFIGDGTYALKPATPSEKYHLRVVTNDSKMDMLTDRFDRLALFFTDTTAKELLAHAPLETGTPSRDAVRFYEELLEQQERDLRVNLQLRILMDLVNRPERSDGLFVAPVDGREHGKVVIAIDPLGISNLSQQFDSAGGEEVALISRSVKNGGFWYLSAREKEAVDGQGKPDRPLADATGYQIDTAINGRQIQGRCTITFTPLSPGIRVLPVQIAPMLDIREASVETAGGSVSLSVVREESSKGDVAVVFPTPLAPGQPVRLRLDYGGGDVLVGGAQGRYAVGARTSWYPNLGTFTDLATYELTFSYPRRLVLVSVGRQESERIEGDRKVSVWKSDQPIRVAGFNYGPFVRLDATDAETGLSVSAYAVPESASYAKGALADAINATRVANAYFGKPAFSHISMTQQVEMSFGQSWPTLVYMPGFYFTSSTERVTQMTIDPRSSASLEQFVDTVGWHEVSHQWWGHQVGWASYRDQWLSEGFADFTAGLMLEVVKNRASYDQYWEGRRHQIVDRTIGGVAPNEAGPITEGFRLFTERSPTAPSIILYSKGGFILHMLRMQMRDDRVGADPDRAFRAMMHDFVTTWAGRNPSTLDFEHVAERHMVPTMDLAGNKRLDYFFDQWVRGTDVPSLKSSLTVGDLGGGRYRISGTVSQSGVPATFLTLVPVYLDFAGRGVQRLGGVRITGSSTENLNVEVSLPSRPRRAMINARNDVLSR